MANNVFFLVLLIHIAVPLYGGVSLEETWKSVQKKTEFDTVINDNYTPSSLITTITVATTAQTIYIDTVRVRKEKNVFYDLNPLLVTTQLRHLLLAREGESTLMICLRRAPMRLLFALLLHRIVGFLRRHSLTPRHFSLRPDFLSLSP